MNTKQSAISSQQSADDFIVNKDYAPVTQEVTDLYWEDNNNVARIVRIVQYILKRDATITRLRTRNEQLEAIARRVVELEDEDGGRSFPPRELIADARRLLVDEQPADAGSGEKG